MNYSFNLIGREYTLIITYTIIELFLHKIFTVLTDI